MAEIAYCLTNEHDWRLVLLALVVCAFGSVTTVGLWDRVARGSSKRRGLWVALTAVTAACTIWATHFIAMLAYAYDINRGLSFAWTLASLLVAIPLSAVAAFAIRAAHRSFPRLLAAAAALTAAVSGMHYTGMVAYRQSALLKWDEGFVVASLAVGLLLSLATAKAFALGGRWRAVLTPAANALSVAAIHFTAMTGVTLVPLRASGSTWVSGSSWLALALGAAVVVIAATASVVLLLDRSHLRRKATEAEHLATLSQELRAARDTAERATEAKSQFLANVSHEIRTPLNGVLGMAQVLSSSSLSADQRECVATIQSSGAALLTIINEILDLTKIETSHVELQDEVFDLLEILEDVATLLAATAERKGVKLHLRHRPRAPRHVRGDGGRVRQIVTNLVGNALKFTDHGHVLIDVGPAGPANLVSIRISDTGIGIPQAKLASIFEAFGQADGTITRTFGGTGLGLTISRSLALMMEGDITVESVEGEGATFTASLRLSPAGAAFAAVRPIGGRFLVVSQEPLEREILAETLGELGTEPLTCATVGEARGKLATGDVKGVILCATHEMFDVADVAPTLVIVPHEIAASEMQPRAPVYVARPVRRDRLAEWLAAPRRDDVATVPSYVADGAEPGDRAHLRLLVVDDSAVNRKVIRKMLSTCRFAIEEADNGRTALRALGRAQFDVVLMDVSMPEMDGLQATSEIRRLEAKTGRQRTSIVGVTAHAGKQDTDFFVRQGMDDTIVKPVQRHVLMDIIGRCRDATAGQAA